VEAMYFPAIRDHLRYGYAVGRIRVLETKLLSRSQYERLVDAASLAEQVRILSETPYGAYLEGVVDADGVEAAMQRVLLDLRTDLLERSRLPEYPVKFFQVLDEYLASREGEPAESEGQAEDEAEALGLYRQIGQLAESSKNAGLRQFFETLVDMANVKVLVRIKARGLDSDLSLGRFVEGGSIPKERLSALCKLPDEDIATELTALGLFRRVDPMRLMDPAYFDVLADEALIRRVRDMAMMTSAGFEPVLGYLVLKRIEIVVVRTLLTGRATGVSRDLLRLRLRDVIP